MTDKKTITKHYDPVKLDDNTELHPFDITLMSENITDPITGGDLSEFIEQQIADGETLIYGISVLCIRRNTTH